MQSKRTSLGQIDNSMVHTLSSPWKSEHARPQATITLRHDLIEIDSRIYEPETRRQRIPILSARAKTSTTLTRPSHHPHGLPHPQHMNFTDHMYLPSVLPSAPLPPSMDCELLVTNAQVLLHTLCFTTRTTWGLTWVNDDDPVVGLQLNYKRGTTALADAAATCHAKHVDNSSWCGELVPIYDESYGAKHSDLATRAVAVQNMCFALT